MSDEAGKLIEGVPFGAARDESVTLERVRPYDLAYSWVHENKCEHNHSLILEQERQVWCKDCRKPVDPFYFLLLYLRRDETLDYRIRVIKEHYEKEQRLRRLVKEREWPPEDLEKSPNQVIKEHMEHGCPRQHMRIDRVYIRCYCGNAWNRETYPELEAEVLAAKAGMEAL